MADDHEWFVDEILGHRWKKGTKLGDLEFEIWWSLGDTTWESYKNCRELEALNHYLEVHGIQHPAQLARRE
jgi:hypothetical protein